MFNVQRAHESYLKSFIQHIYKITSSNQERNCEKNDLSKLSSTPTTEYGYKTI